jgi:Uma2 family endonuclease
MQPAPETSGRVRPLRRTEYEQLVNAGAFVNERIQLLEGELVEMSPQGELHASAIRYLTRFFVRRLGPQYQLGPQVPLAATIDSEPEPDIAIYRAQDYSQHHPTKALLVIEVAGDSLRLDLGVKARIYARAEVPDYWVIDLRHREVVVHRQPDPAAGRYGSVRKVRPGARLTPLKFPKLKVPVAPLVPESLRRH